MKAHQENYLEFLKERYYFEHDRKEKLNSKVNNPMTIIILVLGVVSYYIQNLSYTSIQIVDILFFVFMGITMVGVISTGVYLKKSFYGYDYSYMPKAYEMENYISVINKYYKEPYFFDFKKEEIKRLLDQDMYELYKKKYSECVDQNIKSNTKKNDYLLKTSSLLTATLLFLFFSSIIFYVKSHNIKDIQKVEIININFEEQLMSDKEKKIPPPKPELPKVQTVKEGAFGNSAKGGSTKKPDSDKD